MYPEIIGIFATIIGIISFIPVIMRIYRTNNTYNYPYKTLYLALISNLLWIIYGFYESAYANVIRGTIYSVIYYYILYIKMIT